MSAEFAGILVVQIIGFLTLIVQAFAASKKASGERSDAAAALNQQFEQAREDLKVKAKIDDDRAERDRRWAVEDRAAAAALAREMTVRIDGVARTANAALAATNIGPGLEADDVPPPPVRRQQPGTVADRRAKPVAEPDVDFGAAELFRPDRSAT